MRKLTAWNIYKTIEYSGEQTQLKLYDFFLTLIRNQSLLSGSGGGSGSNNGALVSPRFSISGGGGGGGERFTENSTVAIMGGSGGGSGATGRGRKQSLFSVNTNIDPTFLLEPDESIMASGLDPSNLNVITRIFEHDPEGIFTFVSVFFFKL